MLQRMRTTNHVLVFSRLKFVPEMRGYVSADKYFADIRNSHGYG